MKLAMQIIKLALALSEADSAGIPQALINIVRIAAEAYQAHVGKPIDQSLIKVEPAI